MLGVLVTVGVLGAIVGAIALLVRGGRGAMELAPRNLVRVYLYIASMAGIIVLVVGLSGILTAGFAAAFGNSFVYGDSTPFPTTVSCPPSPDPSVKCAPPGQPDFAQQRVRELDRRRADDLIRGLTFTVFGALFWGAHFAGRRSVMGADELTSGLRRGYLLLGTVIFGIATVILLPTGIYQALSYLILPGEQNGGFRQGVGDTLPGGLVTLPIWLIYLWLVVRDVRATPAAPTTA
ncbi:MAG TPA: hypothetical protein VGT60_00215 [Candidatus Limnocylindria bacterium]|nr:hypothetical protein [Candidatus Limnocylindria bacterium]